MSQSASPEPLPPETVDRSKLRVSDADRAAVVERLRQAHADGQLDLAEFDERTQAAYASRVFADLAPLTADLPTGPLVPFAQQKPAASKPAAPVERRGDGDHGSGVVGLWFFVSFVNVLIWGIVCIAATDLVYPWWIWVAGPWGAVLLLSRIAAAMHAKRS